MWVPRKMRKWLLEQKANLKRFRKRGLFDEKSTRGFAGDYDKHYSAKYNPVSFNRQNVYNFCMKLDGIDREKMKVAAEKVLDENWLPSHSDQYRNAYHPAYRVVYKDYKKLYSLKDLEEDSDENDQETSSGIDQSGGENL